MLKIESKVGKIEESDEQIFHFLSDFSNFDSLISGERIKNWEATRDTCRFTMDGLGEVGMKIIERDPFKLIKVTGDEPGKFNFTFWIQLKKMAEMDTRVKLTIQADINPLVQVMAKKPLQSFLDLLVDQLEQYFKNKQV